MKNIVIFGAGGHSLVVIDLIKELKEYTIIGMYDDNKEGEFDGIPILGQIDSNIIKKADEYIIGIGDDSTRKNIDAIRNTQIATSDGSLIPLEQIAKIELENNIYKI